MKRWAGTIAVAMMAVTNAVAGADVPDAMTRYYVDAAKTTGDAQSAWILSRMLDFSLQGRKGTKEAALAIRARYPIGPDAAPSMVALRLEDRLQPFSGAERAQAMDTLLDAAKDNGYFALTLLSQAEYRDDGESTERLLHLAAAAPNYDSGYSRKIAGLYARLVQLPLPPEGNHPPEAKRPLETRLMMAAALVNMSQDFGWTPLARLCKDAVSPVRDDCRVLGRTMSSKGNTLIDAVIGSSLLRLGASTPAEKLVATQARRKALWQSEAGNPDLPLKESDALRDMTVYRETLFAAGERAALDAVVAARGLPGEPPANWVPRYGGSED